MPGTPTRPEPSAPRPRQRHLAQVRLTFAGTSPAEPGALLPGVLSAESHEALTPARVWDFFPRRQAPHTGAGRCRRGPDGPHGAGRAEPGAGESGAPGLTEDEPGASPRLSGDLRWGLRRPGWARPLPRLLPAQPPRLRPNGLLVVPGALGWGPQGHPGAPPRAGRQDLRACLPALPGPATCSGQGGGGRPRWGPPTATRASRARGSKAARPPCSPAAAFAHLTLNAIGTSPQGGKVT